MLDVAFRTYNNIHSLPANFSQVQPKAAAPQTLKQQGPEGRTKPAGTRPQCLTLLFRTYKKTSFLPANFSQVQPKTAALQTPKQEGPEGLN